MRPAALNVEGRSFGVYRLRGCRLRGLNIQGLRLEFVVFQVYVLGFWI